MSLVREELWQTLKQLASNIQMPWVVFGDFSTTLHYEESVKEGKPVAEDTSELAEVVDQCGLQDLKSTGVFLTWCNKHEGESRMYAKLDRILVNDVWIQELNWLSAHFLNPGISDHAPGIVYPV